MTALLNILWFAGFILSVNFLYATLGMSGLTRMFPEAWRWWHFPSEILTLVFFATMVLYNPFITWSFK